ncbi:MAG: GNAT family N-acetyltransferase [Clostridia bacterium]|nr:GNAT family N-acetyltransferase [Clostridia bacterium]
MNNVFEILPYVPSDHEDFKAISYEWLLEYVSVEPIDQIILDAPYEKIILPGGQIWMAKIKEMNVGTISLMKVDEMTYEIGKLGVSKMYRHIGIGYALMEKALDYARAIGCKNVVLYTASHLVAARKLYEKFGFRYMNENENKYLDADLKMYLKYS